jgi:cytochrome c oxidase assembly protein subunit 15
VVLAVLVVVAWRLRRVQGLQRVAQIILAVSGLQFLTGVSNVVFSWPLLAAVMHTGGAAALVVSLTWALSISRTGVRPVSDFPHTAGRFSPDSRPAA